MGATRNRKKRPVDSGPAGAPEWVVTFTDMISLLVTFFVLLMTFSSIHEFDLLKVDAWLSGNKGIQKIRGYVALDELENDRIAATDVSRGALRPHSRPPDELAQNLQDMGQGESAEHLAIDFATMPDGLVLEFGLEESFPRGSATVPAELRRSLRELGGILEHYPNLVVVEGFTDGSFVPTPFHPDAESLSFARAEAAADVLLRASGLRPELVQIAGLGDAHPRADERSFEGPRLNRRVQIRVLSLSRSRAAYLAAQEEAERRQQR